MNGRGTRSLLRELYRAACDGVDPRRGVARALGEPEIARALARARSVGVFAVGKAAAAMCRGVGRGAGDILAIVPAGDPGRVPERAEVFHSSHPEPSRSSERAARRALEFFASFGADDVLLCLVSGGTSSLLALPRTGRTLTEKRRAVARLAARGASILEINRLRTRLSAVKGGRLGEATSARLVTLVLSDVPGDGPSAVGSGPTIRGRADDLVRVVGTNASGLAAAGHRARELGFRVAFLPGRLEGEARVAGERIGRRARRLAAGEVLLGGGETTVRLPRRHGRGGRSLETALAAAIALAGDRGMALLAAGSDGRDGGSAAAGAFADGTTMDRARRLGLDAGAALAHHDTEPFFTALGDLLATGPTGTNVADWVFALRPPESGSRTGRI